MSSTVLTAVCPLSVHGLLTLAIASWRQYALLSTHYTCNESTNTGLYSRTLERCTDVTSLHLASSSYIEIMLGEESGWFHVEKLISWFLIYRVINLISNSCIAPTICQECSTKNCILFVSSSLALLLRALYTASVRFFPFSILILILIVLYSPYAQQNIIRQVSYFFNSCVDLWLI